MVIFISPVVFFSLSKLIGLCFHFFFVFKLVFIDFLRLQIWLKWLISFRISFPCLLATSQIAVYFNFINIRQRSIFLHDRCRILFFYVWKSVSSGWLFLLKFFPDCWRPYRLLSILILISIVSTDEEAAAWKRMEFTTPFRATMNIY